MKPSQMFNHWDQVRSDLLATIDMFNQDELIFAPFEGSWQVGQIVLHIADCEDNWLHGIVQRKIEPYVFYELKDHPTVAAIKAVLERAHDRTQDLLANLDERDLDKDYTTTQGETYKLGWIIWHVLEHEIHHRGELSLALGLLRREGLDV